MKWFLLLGAIAVIAVGGPYYILHKPSQPAAAAHVHNHLDVPADHQLSVLFIGGSYTFANDLPHMLADVAASDRADPYDIDVDMSATEGARLDDMWKKGEARKLLFSRPWDFVVLQEQSEWVLTDAGVHLTENGIAEWSQDIARAASRMVLYETWPRKPGSVWYNGPGKDKIDYVNPDYMHFRLAANTERLAKLFGALEVPVGEYWTIGWRQTSPPPLYAEDGSHPSVAGTYFTALVFYRYLTRRSPLAVTFEPIGVPPELARQLRTLAAGG